MILNTESLLYQIWNQAYLIQRILTFQFICRNTNSVYLLLLYLMTNKHYLLIITWFLKSKWFGNKFKKKVISTVRMYRYSPNYTSTNKINPCWLLKWFVDFGRSDLFLDIRSQYHTFHHLQKHSSTLECEKLQIQQLQKLHMTLLVRWLSS